MSPTLNVNPTIFVIPCEFLGDYTFTVYNYCHLPSNFSSGFEKFMTIFHHKLLTWEGRVLANLWTRPSSMTEFVHIFIRGVIRKVTILTLNTIFSVASRGEAPSEIIKLHEWFIFHTSRSPHISRDILVHFKSNCAEKFHQCSVYVSQANHIKFLIKTILLKSRFDNTFHITFYPSGL